MTVQTINATVAEIEDQLRAGRKIEEVARDLMEPRNNVIAIWHAMRQRGEIGEAPQAPAAAPAPTLAPVPTPAPAETTEEPPAPVAARSLPDMREQARQVVQPRPEFKQRATNAVELLARADSMDDKRVQGALGRARKAMTDLAAQVHRYESQDEARSRVAALEEELRAARAALRGSTPTRNTKHVTSNEPLACRKGCGRTSPNPQGRAAHERHCTAGA